MSIEHDPRHSADAAAPAWSEQYCQSQWCRAGRLYVRPDPRARDLWLIAEDPEGATWSVAASEAICPRCGEALAPHVEGVGDIDTPAPATLLNFLRSLDRAA